MMIMTWIPSDPEYSTTALQGSANILADLKRRAEDFSPDIKSLWQSIPEDTHCWHNRLSSWTPEPWDNRNGTVTLAGDAAHPMTFRKFFCFLLLFQSGCGFASDVKRAGVCGVSL